MIKCLDNHSKTIPLAIICIITAFNSRFVTSQAKKALAHRYFCLAYVALRPGIRTRIVRSYFGAANI